MGDRRNLIAGLRTVQARVEMDALAATRHRHRVKPHALQDVASQPGDLGAVGQPHPGPRVEVEHQPVGVVDSAGSPKLPLRHVNLEGGHLAEPGQRRQIVYERIGVGVVPVFDAAARHPTRRGVLEVLLEKHLAGCLLGTNTIDPALSGGRAIAGVWDHHGSDGGVVADDIALGRARRRVEHLVEMGELDPVAVDRDDLVAGLA